MSQSSLNEWLGKSIKGYRLEEVLGVGGVGCVFRAVHPLINKQVAIKILQNAEPTAQTLARFFTEAKAANEIRHENVIDIIDFDQTEDKTPFMIMEYLHGKSLASAIHQEAPFSEPRLCHIALQICRALSAANQRGIVHRDLKGDNVFLTERFGAKDFVKVLDFGIAKLLFSDEGLTQTGQLLGTPLCMAPEQVQGLDMDARVDVYAMGVLLFQMSTGRAPFEHDDMLSLIRMHLRQPPPSPREFNPAVSSALESVILRCLQKSPADRFASMEALAKSLEALQRPAASPINPGHSVDITSPFIALPGMALDVPAVPYPKAPSAPEETRRETRPPVLTPEETQRESRAPEPTPDETHRDARRALNPAATLPDEPMTPTLPFAPATLSEDSLLSEESTTVGDRAKRLMAEKILSTAKISALDEVASQAPVTSRTRGSSLLLLGVGLVLAAVLLAILLGVF